MKRRRKGQLRNMPEKESRKTNVKKLDCRSGRFSRMVGVGGDGRQEMSRARLERERERVKETQKEKQARI
jgi:hypothetical protein